MNKFLLFLLLINSFVLYSKEIVYDDNLFSENEPLAKAISNYDIEDVISNLSDKIITANKKQQVLNYIALQLAKRNNGLTRTVNDNISIAKGVIGMPLGGAMVAAAAIGLHKPNPVAEWMLIGMSVYVLLRSAINLESGMSKSDARDKYKKMQAIDLYIKGLSVK